MAHPIARVSGTVADRLRRLDRRLHLDNRVRSEWFWAIPAATFTAIVGLFVFLGMMSGVWAAEYIPTGVVIAGVISGLVVACMNPGSDPPADDRGDRGWGRGPSPVAPGPDSAMWVKLLAEADVPRLDVSQDRLEDRAAEPALR